MLSHTGVLIFVIIKFAQLQQDGGVDTMVEAALPSTMVKVLHYVFAVPYSVLEGMKGVVATLVLSDIMQD